MHTEQDMEQVLTEAQAEKILEAIKTEAIQDEIAYEMARPRISPELDLFDLQNGLGGEIGSQTGSQRCSYLTICDYLKGWEPIEAIAI